MILFCGVGAAAQSHPPAVQPTPSATPWLATVTTTARRLLHGTEELPAAAVRHWRVAVPVVVGTGLFIAYGDAPLSAHIQSSRLESRSTTWSNRGLFAIEPALVLATAAIEERCLFCAGVGNTAAATLTSEAYAMAAVRTLSFAAGRERPGVPLDGNGNFWEGGTSFPSGHATAAFTMASVLAHRYPRAKWAAWAAYATAAGVAGARFSAKEHFPADLLVGSALGAALGDCAVHCQ